MPIAIIQGPKLNLTTKKCIAKEMTELLAKTFELDKNLINIKFEVINFDDFSKGGILLSEKRE